MKNFKLPLHAVYRKPFTRAYCTIRDAEHEYLAEISNKEFADAAVLAINVHDQLVNALREARRVLEKHVERQLSFHDSDESDTLYVLKLVRSALGEPT